jgi:putative nucleotidyltransferase-like protein
MENDSSIAWGALLSSILPERRFVGLLKAILREGPSARAGWAEWTREVDDPRSFFEKDWRGLKGLLALLSQSLRDNGIDAGHDFATYTRVAELREELRGRSFFDTLHAVQRAMDEARLEPILLNGAAHAVTVYAQALARHNHGIDLLLPAGQLEEGKRSVLRASFRHERTTTLPRGVLETYRHRTGLELTLRSRLYLAPHVEAEPADLWSRCEEIHVEGFHVRVLSAADRLCHTLAEAGTAPTCRNLRWACDAYRLLRDPASFNYDRVIAGAVELGTAVPVAMLLDFFRTELCAAVPTEAIAELYRRGGTPRDAENANLLLSMALRTSESIGDFLSRAREQPRLFRSAARFALLPSAEHLAYQRRPTARWRIPWLYVERAGRLLRRPLQRFRQTRVAHS